MQSGVRIGRALGFIFATLGLTWGIHWFTAQHAGGEAFLNDALPPLGMLIPGFVALIIEVFISKESRLHFRKFKEPPRLIVFAYILLTFLVGVITVLGWFTRVPIDLLSALGEILFVLWTLLIIRLYRQCGEESFRLAGLQLGDAERGIPFVIGIVLFFLIQTGLNWVFGLGEFQGLQRYIEGIPIPQAIYPLALVGFFILAVVGTPLSGLAATFGEEYGWRGFLQRELRPMGLRSSTFFIGIIWATWHIPIISSGVHTYPPTPIGYLFAYVFFVLWGFVQSYAVLKTGSVWTVAFLHGVVNSVYSFTLTYLVRPDDKLFSFGLGAYGLVCVVVVVMMILRDPIWSTLQVPETSERP